ncbi:MAG: twin-arginine translocase TatA/TatE family subunit [Candidatus Bathyarchaeia archaeon]
MAFIGPWEIALIIIVVLILFGPKKLPELAKSVGSAIRQYREASEGILQTGTPPPPTAPAPEPKDEKRVLLETAKKLGIETEGKTPDEISEEIVKKTSKTRKRRAPSGTKAAKTE